MWALLLGVLRGAVGSRGRGVGVASGCGAGAAGARLRRGVEGGRGRWSWGGGRAPCCEECCAARWRAVREASVSLAAAETGALGAPLRRGVEGVRGRWSWGGG